MMLGHTVCIRSNPTLTVLEFSGGARATEVMLGHTVCIRSNPTLTVLEFFGGAGATEVMLGHLLGLGGLLKLSHDPLAVPTGGRIYLKHLNNKNGQHITLHL